jgi:hypothetical protein
MISRTCTFNIYTVDKIFVNRQFICMINGTRGCDPFSLKKKSVKRKMFVLERDPKRNVGLTACVCLKESCNQVRC